MADVITIDVNEKPAIDGFENLIDEIVKTDKATDRLEASGNKAVSTINRIKPAAGQSSAALSQMGEKVSQVGVHLTTGNEKLAGFVPNLLRLGPAGAIAVGAVAGLAGGLAILSNTGLKDGKSNLDRLTTSFGGLYKEVGPNINLLKMADDAVTNVSRTIAFNTNALAENARTWVLWAKGVQDTKKTDEYFARTQSGFAKLREEEVRLGEETKKRSQTEGIASVKTIQEINQRLRWLREEQVQIINNSTTEEERDRRLQESFQKRGQLEARLTELEKSSAAERAAAVKAWADQRIAADQRVAASYKQQREIESKAYQESISFQKQVAKDWADFQKGLAADRREGFLNDAEGILRAKAEEEKALAERLQGAAKEAAIKKATDDLDSALFSLRQKRIREEMNQRLQASKVSEVENEIRAHRQTENDAKLNQQTMRAFKNRDAELQQRLKEAQQEEAKIVLDANRKLGVAEGDFKRQQLAKQIQDRAEAANKQIQIEKDKKSALEAAAKDAGVDAGAILNGQDPNQVRRNLMDRARKEAAQRFAQSEQGRQLQETSKFEKQWGSELGVDPNKSANQFRRMQAQAQADAARQASADFQRGKTDPGRLAQAELDAANKTVGAMVSSGKLDAALAQAVGNQLTIAAKQQAQADQLAKDVKSLQDAQNALINAANPARNRAGAGGQRG